MRKPIYLTATVIGLILGSSCNAENSIKATFNEKISISLSSSKVNEPTIHKCGEYICAINGTIIYGSDGAQPTDRLSKLSVKIDAHQYELNTDGMYDPGVTKNNVTQRITVTHYWGDLYKVTGQFSDGAGAYIAQWTIGKSASIRNFIGNSEELSELSEWRDKQ